MFGQIISLINSSVIALTDVYFNQYELINTLFTNFSGQLVGMSNFSTITVIKASIIEVMLSNVNSQFNMFGLIGFSSGTLYIESLQAIYQLYNSTYYNYVGVFGYVNGTSSDFTNVILQFVISQQQAGLYVGVLAGVLLAFVQNIESITIENSFITSSYSAGLIASICSNINLNMVNIRDSTINCSSNILSTSTWSVSGSLIGQVLDQIFQRNNQMHVQILQCIIQSMSIYTYHNITWSLAGGLIGDSHTTPLFIQFTIVNKSDIQASGPVTNVVTASGLVSYLYCQNQINFTNIKVCNTNLRAISTTSQSQSCSGIFSHVVYSTDISQITLYLSNSVITSVSLFVTGSSTLSGIILNNNKILYFTANQVSTEGINTINGAALLNCANIINQSQNGC
ncbi:Hypothetical_protein [Hexamita inflata]|uniref:Hypothetical_protein n=1 Tax=Hexamita inflata TaxID=28002 RepID=A0AA86Q6F7_9EUKA|nr:Hypothetical protein HINF_LOCUS39762 [Hexamita inflata]CAI9952118.1 Hypothetical protein HINF_LOCUS39763 [Hexamita inflata]